MSLTSCPDCGAQASTEAPSCPRCGHPFVRRGGGSRLLLSLGVALAVLLLAVLGARELARRRAEAEPRPPEERVDFVEGEERARDPAAGAPPAPATAPDTGASIAIGDLDEPPRLLNREEVMEVLTRQYPPLLRDGGVTGNAVVRFRITRDGAVDPATPRTIESSHPLFAEAALRVVARMRFRPGVLDGEPRAVWVDLPVTFALAPH